MWHVCVQGGKPAAASALDLFEHAGGLQGEAALLVRCILMRAGYGGMAGDVELLKREQTFVVLFQDISDSSSNWAVVFSQQAVCTIYSGFAQAIGGLHWILLRTCS